MDKPSYEPIGSILSSFFEEKLSAKAGKVNEFFKSWRSIAGERLASHSRVAEVENGIVIVEADHPSWIQLLQMRQEEMLAAIERGWPELSVRGIAFRLRRDGPQRAADAAPEAPPRRPPAETEEEARSAAPRKDAPVKDARLSKALEKLKETIAERRKPGKG